ncbi:hypothetical protein MYCO108962_26085 [Mycobacterium colombiense]
MCSDAAVGGIGSSRSRVCPITRSRRRGPGTLVASVTMARCGRRESNCKTLLRNTVGRKPIADSTMPGGWAVSLAFHLVCTVSNRRTGSSCSTGRCESIAERTGIGTRVRSESARGSSPRPSSAVRNPSVMAASATSLALTPNLRQTLSTSAIGTRTVL